MASPPPEGTVLSSTTSFDGTQATLTIGPFDSDSSWLWNAEAIKDSSSPGTGTLSARFIGLPFQELAISFTLWVCVWGSSGAASNDYGMAKQEARTLLIKTGQQVILLLDRSGTAAVHYAKFKVAAERTS